MTLKQKPIKNIYVRAEATPITTAGIYRSEYLGLISYSSDGNTWVTISDKNVGASKVYNFGDALQQANCGKYFQRGNNYGFPFSGSITTSGTTVSASGYGPGNYYSSSTFITAFARDSSNNANLWGDTTNTNEARRGPCDEGFHIPSNSEVTALNNYIGTFGLNKNGEGYMVYFKMPKSGYRRQDTGAVYNQGSSGTYTTTTQESNTRNYYLVYSDGSSISTEYKSHGRPIRPFKNVAVQPDSSREKLR